MKKDIIVEIIELGKRNLILQGNGITHKYIKDEILKKGFSFDEPGSEIIIFSVLYSSFESQNNMHGDNRYKLKIEAYFSYLEYEELEDARASSKRATVWAIAALVVSIVSSLISIYYGQKQLETPTEIRQEQIELLINNLKQ
jgi:hypothetical protein